MRRIRLAYFKNLRNGEHVHLHGSIISLLKKKLLAGLGLTELGNDYLAAFDTENVAYKNNATVIETKDVEEAVERRDAAFKRINFAVKSAALSEAVEEEAAGRLLQNVFDRYKYVYQRSYMESVAEVTNLVGELTQPPYASAVERLGLSDAVETLSFRNEAFAMLYNERSVARHAIQMRGTMPEIRRRVDKTYRALTEGINVLYAANELTGKNAEVRRQLTNLIETINSFVEQTERVYYRRVDRTNDEKTSTDAVEANHLLATLPPHNPDIIP
jgi:hypothetical protein